MIITEAELNAWAKDFYTELSTSGPVSLYSCFERTIDRQPNETFRQILGGVLGTVALGYPLSKAMSLQPEVFPETFRTIVRYGEIYGELDATLQRYLERPEEMSRPCGVNRPA